MILINSFNRIFISHIDREFNFMADELSKKSVGCVKGLLYESCGLCKRVTVLGVLGFCIVKLLYLKCY